MKELEICEVEIKKLRELYCHEHMQGQKKAGDTNLIYARKKVKIYFKWIFN